MSKPQVTITLGRSGQVVKRPAPVDSSRSDHVTLSGNKRSIRERLGNQSRQKRQKRDGIITSNDDNMNGAHVDQDDLRFKLMRKNRSRRSSSNGELNMDLREKLSRTTQPPSRNDTRQRVPESGFPRRIPPTRSADDLLQMESSRKSYSAWNLDGLRRRSPDRLVGTSRGISPPRHIDERRQVRAVDTPPRHIDERRKVRAVDTQPRHIDERRQVRAIDDPPRHIDERRQVRAIDDPPRHIDERRQVRAIDDPPRHIDERRQVRTVDASRHSARPVDTSRSIETSRPIESLRATYMSKDVYSGSRPTSFMTKSTLPIESAKPVARLPPPTAPGMMPKSSYLGEEQPQAVANLLNSLGLGKYAILFQAEEVDMTALKQMGDHDLKELGIPMGPRKKILLAVMPPRMKHHRQP